MESRLNETLKTNELLVNSKFIFANNNSGCFKPKELTHQLLHSLVEKIACTAEGDIQIQYTLINPIQKS